MKLSLFATTLGLALTLGVHAQDKAKSDLEYINGQDVPNGIHFLPNPPTEGSAQFLYDQAQYYWGKSLRDTPRGQLALADFDWKPAYMAKIFSVPFGVEISDSLTPAVNRLIYNVVYTGARYATSPAKSYFNRLRPFGYFKEASITPDRDSVIIKSASYPSGHTSRGYMVALALASLNPANGDTIMARAYEYGQSRVICGHHWQSDVDAARIGASALFARLQTDSAYQAQWALARQEVLKLEAEGKIRHIAYTESFYTPNRGYADHGMIQANLTSKTKTYERPYVADGVFANSREILPNPPAENSVEFLYDQYQYHDGKVKRQTPRAEVAIADAVFSAQGFADNFEGAYGITISEATTPELWKLLSQVMQSERGVTSAAKNYYQRMRPYVFYNEGTLVPEDEKTLRTNGSFPSGHTTMGTVWGLILAEINVANEDSILSRTYDFGQSRVIAGYHWQSDVTAGRFLGATFVARLHADKKFMKQLERAKKEFLKLDKQGKIRHF